MMKTQHIPFFLNTSYGFIMVTYFLKKIYFLFNFFTTESIKSQIHRKNIVNSLNLNFFLYNFYLDDMTYETLC